eukprot:TRINITY_DN16592_c0_g1_i1.p1 TRINITY_DN16592_c0_g1~~TRINITY_DN16592_c0_g1_i1.p1  ORF type:complete len:117 (-),score=18.11 TRINITY_DN16592_c0_g1_i1:254-604(-)
MCIRDRFTTYNKITGALKEDVPKRYCWILSMFAGGSAGAISAVVTQPLDTVKTNMMGLEGAQYKSSFSCFRKLVSSGGVISLYRGLQPRLIRVITEVALQFAAFEQISTLVSRASN